MTCRLCAGGGTGRFVANFYSPTNPGVIVPVIHRALVQNDSATADSLLGIAQDFFGYWILLLCWRCVDRVLTLGLSGVMPVSDPL